MEGYEHIPDRGIDWTPTKAQVRRQRERDDIRRHAQAAAASAPPLSKETIQRVAALMSHPTPPTELMRWRLRLFCGHVVMRAAHYTHATVHAAFTGTAICEECGLDPATIVAAEAIGRVAEPRPVLPAEAAIDRGNLENAIARHEREIARLRSQFEVDGGAGPDSRRRS